MERSEANELKNFFEDRDSARELFEFYFTKKWNKRREEVLLINTLRRVNRLKKIYPDEWEKVIDKYLGSEFVKIDRNFRNQVSSGGMIERRRSR